MERKYGVRLRWLSACCYEIDCGGIHIVTDPHITLSTGTDLTYEVVERCDILSLTHTHWDHVTDVPNLAKKFEPLILCPERSMAPLAQWLDYNPSRIYPMYPDVELDFGHVKVRAIYTRHVNSKMGTKELNETFFRNYETFDMPEMYALQPPGSLGCLSYLFTMNNGVKILFWLGNLTREQLPLCAPLDPDILIVQLAQTPRGMAQRADFASDLGVGILMPHHHALRKSTSSDRAADFGEVVGERTPHITYINPRHGEWMDL